MMFRLSKSRIILIFLFVLFLPFNSLIRANVVQASQGTVVAILPNNVSADIGQPFTINITVLNVQNLYGLDVTINWNSSVLQFINVDVRLGHTDTDGVLYNSSLTSPPYIVVNNVTGGSQYEIAATSVAPAPSFNGSGNIVRITFEANSSGYSNIAFSNSELWDYPPPDRDPRISEPIDHTSNGSQFVTVPEIPSSAIFLAFAVLTVFALVLSKKINKKAHSRISVDTRDK